MSGGARFLPTGEIGEISICSWQLPKVELYILWTNFPKDVTSKLQCEPNWVVVSNIFYFHPYLGKIPILTNIFQRG